MRKFEVVAPYSPSGDQPKTIDTISQSILDGNKYQTIKGVTGSGKTYTMAKIIEKIQKPTLIVSHNKTLSAQLYHEFKTFFPNNAVEYFVSYYDYYQPEAYIAARDMYIEKDSSINDEIEKMRLAATAQLYEREDVLIVASVSCIYGLGNPGSFKDMRLTLRPMEHHNIDHIVLSLVQLQYERNDIHLQTATFRKRGDVLDVFLAYFDEAFRLTFDFDVLAKIEKIDPLTGAVIELMDYLVIYPAKHFVMTTEAMRDALVSIEKEMIEQVAFFESKGKLVEATRIKQRTLYDLDMLKEIGTCKGIENYSAPLSYRNTGDRPACLIDYFPKDFVLFMDESHVTRTQIGAMYEGDRVRKTNLVDYGFRLPSAKDNRPLKYDEFESVIPQTVYVSATPAKYEMEQSSVVAELIIRPTGLLDPQIEVRPTKGQIEDLYSEIRKRVDRNERSVVLTLTKKMAEDMSEYFGTLALKVRYLHSEIETIERVEILRDLRLGKFDVLIGVNLLREGIDLPEVTLVAIMDADKIGFLRSTTSLMQIAGRAARNSNGFVIMYADKESDAMKEAIAETNRRRELQIAYNTERGITPTTVQKEISDMLKREEQSKQDIAKQNLEILRKGVNLLNKKDVKAFIKRLEQEMNDAAVNMDFEQAAVLRDEIIALKEQVGK